MRIVVLDEFGMSVDDIARLEEHGDVRVFSSLPADADDIVLRARGAEVILSGWTRFDEAILSRLPDLRLISLGSTGLDLIDVSAASARGVAVCHVPSYATNAVAELALGLMLAVVRKIPVADRHMRATQRMDWQAFRGSELGGKTLGVVGTGAIGRRVARLGRCLGMTLLGCDVRPSEDIVAETGMRYASLQDVFVESDVVTLHAPLVGGTEHLVDAGLLRLMKPHAVLINTARARLVRQDDLYHALAHGTIAGAGLDVLDLTCESGLKLLALDNVVCTPHVGFNTPEAASKLTAIAAENAARFLEGAPDNVVNPHVLPALHPTG